MRKNKQFCKVEIAKYMFFYINLKKSFVNSNICPTFAADFNNKPSINKLNLSNYGDNICGI